MTGPEPDEAWERRYRRERQARLEAEEIAETAIAELHASNRDLDRQVAERTEQLASALARTAAADEAKATFLHGLAHELSTPLHAVAGLVELIRERSVVDEVVTTAQQVEQAADRLNRTLRTLVEFSAAMGGDLEVHPTEVSVGDLADQVMERWRRRAAQRGTLVVAEARPSPLTRVRVDTARLEQVVDPLVDNALVHGSGRVGVEIEAGAPPAAVLRVRVGDEGPGVAAGLRAQVFDPFVRGGSEEGSGLGIGLTLAGAVATALGGSLVLLDREPASVFEAELPIPD